MLTFFLIALVSAVLVCVWLLFTESCKAFWLMIAALSAALRRARLTGTRPWHHNHAIRAQIASAAPPIDDFKRLTCEAMVYATQPNVSVMHHVAAWPQDQVLIRTTADPYGRRTYIERLQLIGGQVVHVVCLYLDGAETPTEVGSLQFPAEQTGISVLRVRIEDIVSAGPFLSFRDYDGRIREARLPKDVRHHA
jgi:hypothetical protein